MRRGPWLLPVALLGALLALYAVAKVCAQANAATPALEAMSAAPRGWTVLALGWGDDSQIGLWPLNELAGNAAEWSAGGSLEPLGADPSLQSGASGGGESATPLPATVLLLGSGLLGLGIAGWMGKRK